MHSVKLEAMAPFISTPALLTPDDVATQLQMHRDTVRRLLREGTLPGLKIGRSWRVRREALDLWIEQQGENS